MLGVKNSPATLSSGGVRGHAHPLQLHCTRRGTFSSSSPRPSHPRTAAPVVALAASGSTSTSALLPVPRLVQFYNEVQQPAKANRRYSLCIIDFVNEAIQAFACGFNEVQLHAEVDAAVQKYREQNPGALQDFDKEDCMRCIMIVWTTLLISPRSVRRWATESPVSEGTFSLWRGFCTMIVSGYFEKRMAWYPIDRLSTELALSQDLVETPDRVAERARIVYTVLETVFPQFPSA